MINEINFLRFVAIFLMMVVHVPHLTDYLTSSFDSLAAVIVTAGQYGFGRISSPLIGLVSGYFCIGMIAARGPRGFVGRKLQTLVVPLVFWNLLDIGILTLLFFTTAGDYYKSVWDLSPGAVVGLLDQPVNYPLHYLADLFKCCLIFAGVHLVARRVGLVGPAYARLLVAVGVGLTIGLDIVSINFPESAFAAREHGLRLGVRSDLALFFFLGAALAAAGISLTDLLDTARLRVSWAGVAVLFVLMVVLALASVGIDIRHGPASAVAIAFDTVKRFIGAGFLLAAIARLSAAGLTFEVSSRLAFRMFCSHVIFYQIFTIAGVRPNTGFEAVVYLVAYPVAATLLAWASLEAQGRLGRTLRPGPLRRVIEAIP